MNVRNQDTQSHDLADHDAFSRTFQPGQLSIGFIAPACGYPDSPFPSLSDQAEIVQSLENQMLMRHYKGFLD